jgi:hypothetical protein
MAKKKEQAAGNGTATPEKTGGGKTKRRFTKTYVGTLAIFTPEASTS